MVGHDRFRRSRLVRFDCKTLQLIDVDDSANTVVCYDELLVDE